MKIVIPLIKIDILIMILMKLWREAAEAALLMKEMMIRMLVIGIVIPLL